MNHLNNPYFAQEAVPKPVALHQVVLERCISRLREQMPLIGLRNPKIGDSENRWHYCTGSDWVMGFYSGQLWLAYQLTGDPAFRNQAQARRPDFRHVLRDRRSQDHDLGFQFSLHSVADWLLTADPEARKMALAAAEMLLSRFRPEGGYIQAWTCHDPADTAHAAFVSGRMIADTMQNMGLLLWAHRETGISDFLEVVERHAATTAKHLVRNDSTTYHTFVFDPATGAPLRGETHQGHCDTSCWSRGQAWLIHGFAGCFAAIGNHAHLDVARQLATCAEALLGDSEVPVWDFALPDTELPYLDSSAGAVMAAGLYMLADHTSEKESLHWRAFADRLLSGLIANCDLTTTQGAQGLLGQGAAHVPAGRVSAMLPYGDYYFMEALMRAQGHNRFFW